MRLLNVFFLIPISVAYAQKEANVWYFGNQAGLDFNVVPPKTLLDGALVSNEASAIMSNQKGELLFYTNGETVWSKNHLVVSNGSDLGGNNSSQQGAIIVPKPGSSNLYYIFTTGAFEGGSDNGLMYSLVDINLNNGDGEITQKNVQLHTPSSESLDAVGSCRQGESDFYWVVAGKKDESDALFAYQIDQNGVNPNPVVSIFQNRGEVNYFKFSPSANKVAFVDRDFRSDAEQAMLVIGDFDFETGMISNFKYIDIQPNFVFNQLEFSGDGSFLYVTSEGSILQFNVSSEVGIPSSSVEVVDPILGDLQLAPDGKIYVVTGFGEFLSVIRGP